VGKSVKHKVSSDELVHIPTNKESKFQSSLSRGHHSGECGGGGLTQLAVTRPKGSLPNRLRKNVAHLELLEAAGYSN
jgi:hypothetical protein